MTWLRIRSEQPHQGDGTYINMENSSRIGAHSYQSTDLQGRQAEKWRVYFGGYQQSAQTIGDGYATEAEALAAVDELLSQEDFNFVQLQPPVSDEETSADGDTQEEEVK